MLLSALVDDTDAFKSPQGSWDMERILRIADQYYCIINAIETPFISVGIIAPATNCHKNDIGICLPDVKGKLTDLLFYAAGVQYPVRLQCADSIEAFFDKSVHDPAACIPAVAKKIRDHWRYRKFVGNLLHNLHFRPGLIVHDDGIVKNNAVTGEHDCHSLMSIVLLPLKMGLVEIHIFNRMQSL